MLGARHLANLTEINFRVYRQQFKLKEFLDVHALFIFSLIKRGYGFDCLTYWQFAPMFSLN